MNISINYESPKIPDYVKGETVVHFKKLTMNFDGIHFDTYSEFMDKDDIKEVIELIKTLLKNYKKRLK